jgi:hypothetical protein
MIIRPYEADLHLCFPVGLPLQSGWLRERKHHVQDRFTAYKGVIDYVESS